MKIIQNESKKIALALAAIVSIGCGTSASAAVTNDTTATTTVISTDVNGDGAVNVLDLSLVASAYRAKKGSAEYKEAYDINSDGIIDIIDIVSVAKDITVKESTEAPGTFQISKDNWDGSPDYTITMNMWFGSNGDLWRLYENGKLIAEIPLVNNTPNAQTASYSFTNKPNKTYVYTAELVNSAGVTQAKDSVTQIVTKNETPIEVDLPDSASGTPAVGYSVLNEDENTFEWAVFIANPNKSYVWNGKEFSAWGLTFDTDAEITSVSNCGSYTQENGKVTIDLKQDERLLEYNTTRVFVVQGNKKSNKAPSNFQANLIRGDMEYPEYATLPSSWSKNKKDLSIKDLIADEKDYYNTEVKGNTGNMLMYNNPAHKTQIQLGLPQKMPVPVNGVNGLRIWIPSEYLAMGLATGTELFGLNPNYMVGLSIKENFTCGLVPVESGYNENLTTIDGVTWSWPIQKKHADGPFQQEKGNFNEVKKQYQDYLSPNAEHQNIVTLKTGEADDPSYVSSAITSYISLTMTREFLYAVPNNKFSDFIKNSKDPWAEYVLVDNAYNRGVYGLLQRNLFTTSRDQAINSTDINKDFDLSGFASHIETIKSVIEEMDKETEHVYDAKITWDMMENYLTELRIFYDNGTPTDAEWNDMKSDLKRAFDLLSAHWGDNTISFRYDFLTLFRVIEQYVPADKRPNPTGASWIEQVVSANNQAASASSTTTTK